MLTYGDSVWTGGGYVGRVCSDVDRMVILHETAGVYPTEEGAWLAAVAEWSAIVDEALGEAA